MVNFILCCRLGSERLKKYFNLEKSDAFMLSFQTAHEWLSHYWLGFVVWTLTCICIFMFTCEPDQQTNAWPSCLHSLMGCAQPRERSSSACKQSETKLKPGRSCCPVRSASPAAGPCHAERWRLNSRCSKEMTGLASSPRFIIEVLRVIRQAVITVKQNIQEVFIYFINHTNCSTPRLKRSRMNKEQVIQALTRDEFLT